MMFILMTRTALPSSRLTSYLLNFSSLLIPTFVFVLFRGYSVFFCMGSCCIYMRYSRSRRKNTVLFTVFWQVLGVQFLFTVRYEFQEERVRRHQGQTNFHFLQFFTIYPVSTFSK